MYSRQNFSMRPFDSVLLSGRLSESVFYWQASSKRAIVGLQALPDTAMAPQVRHFPSHRPRRRLRTTPIWICTGRPGDKPGRLLAGELRQSQEPICPRRVADGTEPGADRSVIAGRDREAFVAGPEAEKEGRS